MKTKIKLFLSIISILFILPACGVKNSDDTINQLEKKIEKANSYYVEGNMDIINNEDTYSYDVKVSYKKDNYYKINLTNKLNNHEQVILRNDEGVYV